MLPAHPNYISFAFNRAGSAGHPGSKQTPVKRGGFVLPGRVKQRKHESGDVSFSGPVQSAGVSKQTIKFYYFLIVPSKAPGNRDWKISDKHTSQRYRRKSNEFHKKKMFFHYLLCYPPGLRVLHSTG
jgi:hypothetical protein